MTLDMGVTHPCYLGEGGGALTQWLELVCVYHVLPQSLNPTVFTTNILNFPHPVYDVYYAGFVRHKVRQQQRRRVSVKVLSQKPRTCL